MLNRFAGTLPPHFFSTAPFAKSRPTGNCKQQWSCCCFPGMCNTRLPPPARAASSVLIHHRVCGCELTCTGIYGSGCSYSPAEK